MKLQSLKLTEAQFTRQILQLAKLRGWRSAHFRPARTKDGWRTAVSGDGKGWPDIFLVRGKLLIAWEAKIGRNEPTAEQWEWIYALQFAGVNAGWVRPCDWDYIETTLA